MNSPQTLYALRWLVRDTFAQARAGKVFWIMLAVTGLAVIFCLGVSVAGGNLDPEGDFLHHPKTGAPLTGADGAVGQLQLLFGAFRVPLARSRESAVQLLQVILATWLAGSVGLLGTLIWTAGFIPEFLHDANAALLLSKPVPRWLLVVGKYLGVVLFVALQTGLFFFGTWLALGLKTNMWTYGYLAGIPILMVHFVVLYGFTVFVGVWTRSTLACILGSILFWALCMGLNYGRYAALSLPQLAPDVPPLAPVTGFMVEAAYWVFPKPMDFIVMLEQAVGASTHMATLSSMPEFVRADEAGKYLPEAAIATSLGFAIVMLWCAGDVLRKKEM